MMEDPIIEELHKFREEWAAQFYYDIHALVADLRRSQLEENRPVVNLPPKRITEVSVVQKLVSDSIHDEKVAKPSPEELNQAA